MQRVKAHSRKSVLCMKDGSVIKKKKKHKVDTFLNKENESIVLGSEFQNKHFIKKKKKDWLVLAI